MKGDTFMRKSFVVFYSDTALFDEAMYPSCGSVRPKRTTRIDEPPSNQPDLSDDITIPGDSDDPPPEPKQERRAPQPDGLMRYLCRNLMSSKPPPDDQNQYLSLMSYLLFLGVLDESEGTLLALIMSMVINTLRKLLKTLSGLAIGSA